MLILIGFSSDFSMVIIFTDNNQRQVEWIYIVIGLLHFCLNMYFLTTLLSMCSFLLTYLGMYSKSINKFKIFLYFVIFIFVLTQIRYFVYSQVWQSL